MPRTHTEQASAAAHVMMLFRTARRHRRATRRYHAMSAQARLHRAF